MFSYARQKGETGPGKKFCNVKRKYFINTGRPHTPKIQESGGGKCPPLAGIRKPRTESGACEEIGEQEIHSKPRSAAYINV
jgi:hypothetical protein